MSLLDTLPDKPERSGSLLDSLPENSPEQYPNIDQAPVARRLFDPAQKDHRQDYQPTDTVLPRRTLSEYDVNAGEFDDVGGSIQGAQNLSQAPRKIKALTLHEQPDILTAMQQAERAKKEGIPTGKNRPLIEAGNIMATTPKAGALTRAAQLIPQKSVIRRAAEEISGIGENIANQVTQFGAMGLTSIPNIIGSAGAELADSFVNQRMPTAQGVADRFRENLGVQIYQPVGESGQRQVAATNSILSAFPDAVDAVDDATGEKFKKTFPNAYAATQVAGEFAPFIIAGKLARLGVEKPPASMGDRATAGPDDYAAFMQTYSAATGVHDVSAEFFRAAEEFKTATENGDRPAAAKAKAKVEELAPKKRAFDETVDAFSVVFEKAQPSKAEVNQAITAMREKMAVEEPQTVETTGRQVKEVGNVQEAAQPEPMAGTREVEPAQAPARAEGLPEPAMPAQDGRAGEELPLLQQGDLETANDSQPRERGGAEPATTESETPTEVTGQEVPVEKTEISGQQEIPDNETDNGIVIKDKGSDPEAEITPPGGVEPAERGGVEVSEDAGARSGEIRSAGDRREPDRGDVPADVGDRATPTKQDPSGRERPDISSEAVDPDKTKLDGDVAKGLPYEAETITAGRTEPARVSDSGVDAGKQDPTRAVLESLSTPQKIADLRETHGKDTISRLGLKGLVTPLGDGTVGITKRGARWLKDNVQEVRDEGDDGANGGDASVVSRGSDVPTTTGIRGDVVRGDMGAVAQAESVKAAESPAKTVKPAKVKTPPKIDRTKDDVAVAISKLGGLDLDEAHREWGDVVKDSRKDLASHVLRETRRFGNVFKKGGMPLDKMRESLVGHGYLTEGADLHDLYTVIEDATRGKLAKSAEAPLDAEMENEAKEHEARILAMGEAEKEAHNAILDAVEGDDTIKAGDDSFDFGYNLEGYDFESDHQADHQGSIGTSKARAEKAGDGRGEVQPAAEQTDDAGGWRQETAVKGSKKTPTIGEVQKQGGKRIGTSALMDGFTPEPAGLFDTTNRTTPTKIEDTDTKTLPQADDDWVGIGIEGPELLTDESAEVELNDEIQKSLDKVAQVTGIKKTPIPIDTLAPDDLQYEAARDMAEGKRKKPSFFRVTDSKVGLNKYLFGIEKKIKNGRPIEKMKIIKPDGTVIDAGETTEQAVRRAIKSGQTSAVTLDAFGGQQSYEILAKSTKAFINQDVKRVFAAGGQGAADTVRMIQHALSPTSGVNPKYLDAVMRMKGDRDKAEYMLEVAGQSIKNLFDDMERETQVEFIDRIKRGQDQKTPELAAIAKMIRAVDTSTWNEASKYKPGMAWKEDHYRVLWKVIPGQKDVKGAAARFFGGRRPLQGTKGFLKQATLDDMSQGIEMGGEPFSYNPWIMFSMAQADMQKFITAQKMWEEIGNMGGRKFVRKGAQAPEGFIKLNDRLAKVFFPIENYGKIIEKEDRQELTRDLDEKITTVGPSGKMDGPVTEALMSRGWSESEAKQILGRVKSNGGGTTTIEKTVERIITVEKSQEFEAGKGFVELGEWWIDEGAGRILNNHLSRDYVRESAIGRGLLAVKNNTTAMELALSAFHFTFETVETASSNLALAARKFWNVGVLQGNKNTILSAMKDLAATPISPASTARLGGSAIRYMKDKDVFLETARGKRFIKAHPEFEEMIDALFHGGGKLAIHQEYKINSIRTMNDNINSGNYIGAAIRSIPALNETVMKPLFEIYIPRLKVGMFLKEYPLRLQERSADIAAGKITKGTLARETWAFVEDRLGEMNFDNLFWDRTFKSSMQLMFRSVTWKLGNIRAMWGSAPEQISELYHSVKDKRVPRIEPKIAWLLATGALTSALAYVTQKMYTGDDPENIKDLVYPRVGKNERVTMPTYIKDAQHLVHDPVGYVTSSFSGVWGRVADNWRNRDFYGQEVYSLSDNAFEKYMKETMHVIPAPFSVTSMQAQKNAGLALSRRALSFIGVNKAPAYINYTPAQMKAMEIMDRHPRGTRTEAEVDRSKLAKRYLSELREGARVQSSIFADIDQAEKDHKLTHRQKLMIRDNYKNPPIVTQVKSFTLPELAEVIKESNNKEKQLLRPLLIKKANSAKDIEKNEKESYLKMVP